MIMARMAVVSPHDLSCCGSLGHLRAAFSAIAERKCRDPGRG
jgi:hypothetical protein